MMKSSKEALQIAVYINRFINEYCPLSKTVSEHTVRSYTDSLKLYLDFLETKKKITVVLLSYEYFQANTIEEWMIWLMNERDCKPQTVNVRLSSLRTFLNYLRKQDIALNYLYVESQFIKKKKVPKNKVKGMSKNVVKAISNTIDQSTICGRRDLTMFILLYDTAARIDEVLSLKIKDVHLGIEKPNIIITGKGNKNRCLGLNTKTIKCLKRYLLECHGENPKENSYLFYSKIKGKDEKITQPAVCKQLRKWAKLANKICKEVPINLHPHQIRHATATHWLENGMNIGEIQYLLGHENIQTTMVYLDITLSQKAAAIESLMCEEEKNTKKIWMKDIKELRDLCK